MHAIFGPRFVSWETPAWHNLGHVANASEMDHEELTARRAYEMAGTYEVGLKDLRIVGLPKLDIPQRAIVRQPTDDDPQHKVFGIVGPEFELLDPDRFVAIWDEFVGLPIQTLGVLKQGLEIFATTKLPAFDVKGDEVDDYLLFHVPMDGLRAMNAAETPVRVVCQNTLSAGLNAASSRVKIKHDTGSREKAGLWLQWLAETAKDQASMMKEAFSILADNSPSPADTVKVLTATYPTPKVPAVNAPPAVMESRMKVWEQLKEESERLREAANSLFEGDGTGMDHPAAKGTYWGLYNAVVETEDKRRGGSTESAAYDALFGRRAEAKKRAFAKARSLVSAA